MSDAPRRRSQWAPRGAGARGWGGAACTHVLPDNNSPPPVIGCSSGRRELGRQRALAAQQGQLDLTACDRCGTRRVGRAVQGGTGLWCWAIACGGGPPPRVRTSCTGCTRALGYGATHGTEARACWGRRATGATLYRPWSVYATGTVPLSRPRPLGRPPPPEAGARRREGALLVSFRGGGGRG